MILYLSGLVPKISIEIICRPLQILVCTWGISSSYMGPSMGGYIPHILAHIWEDISPIYRSYMEGYMPHIWANIWEGISPIYGPMQGRIYPPHVGTCAGGYIHICRPIYGRAQGPWMRDKVPICGPIYEESVNHILAHMRCISPTSGPMYRRIYPYVWAYVGPYIQYIYSLYMGATSHIQ